MYVVAFITWLLVQYHTGVIPESFLFFFFSSSCFFFLFLLLLLLLLPPNIPYVFPLLLLFSLILFFSFVFLFSFSFCFSYSFSYFCVCHLCPFFFKIHPHNCLTCCSFSSFSSFSSSSTSPSSSSSFSSSSTYFSSCTSLNITASLQQAFCKIEKTLVYCDIFKNLPKIFEKWAVYARYRAPKPPYHPNIIENPYSSANDTYIASYH